MQKSAVSICSATALLLGAVAIASAQGGKQPPVDTSTAPDHKAYICHLPGHDGDALITGRGFGCVEPDRGAGEGIIILISKKAACKGHKIEDACAE